jgi:hypothetical protein
MRGRSRVDGAMARRSPSASRTGADSTAPSPARTVYQPGSRGSRVIGRIRFIRQDVRRQPDRGGDRLPLWIDGDAGDYPSRRRRGWAPWQGLRRRRAAGRDVVVSSGLRVCPPARTVSTSIRRGNKLISVRKLQGRCPSSTPWEYHSQGLNRLRRPFRAAIARSDELQMLPKRNQLCAITFTLRTTPRRRAGSE